MNALKTLVPLILMVAAVGCASRPAVIVNESVGPDLARPRVNLSKGNGELVVYTALEVADPASSDFPTHESYEIYDMDGNLVRRVDNRSGPFYQNPKPVSLPAGKYQVQAPATNHGRVSVSVVVKEAETTTLDLDASHFRQHKPTGAGQWVRLPSGEVIGMREP